MYAWGLKCGGFHVRRIMQHGVQKHEQEQGQVAVDGPQRFVEGKKQRKCFLTKKDAQLWEVGKKTTGEYSFQFMGEKRPFQYLWVNGRMNI